MASAEELKEKLRKAIAKKISAEGWSQSEAGELCGLSRIHMNHVVKGSGIFAFQKLVQIAEDLGLNVEVVIKDKKK